MSAGEVKLLTEAEVRRDLTDACVGLSEIERLVRKWGERGLIAPEPEVDPLHKEALALAETFLTSDLSSYDLAFAALRRGMELRPELTRERVREAVIAALLDTDMLDRSDFDDALGTGFRDRAEEIVGTIHAALTDGGRDG